MVSRNLDMDVLRTFVVGTELGNFAKAAERLGRSPSAVSLQLRKLEEQIGKSLLLKKGRGLVLTDAGETLLSYAQRLLDLNDETLMALRGSAISGWVRLGLPQDLAEFWLPGLLARFSKAHPNIRVEAHVDRNRVLIEQLEDGKLDLAIIWEDTAAGSAGKVIVEYPMEWIGPPSGFSTDPDESLKLVTFAPPCIFREAGLAALDAAGISWRTTFSSQSLSGLWAAVSAGLGVTIRTPYGIPSTALVLDAAATGLPRLPKISLSLRTASAQSEPVVGYMEAVLFETLSNNLLNK